MMSMDNIPNWMTVLRIAVTPAIAILIWIDDPSYGYLVALILFTVASITDYLDGMLARQMKIESGFGEMLDPIADKMLVGAVLLALASVETSGWLFLVPALLILSREFMISGLREYLAKVNFSVPVTPLAKWKTTVQILALGTLIGWPAFPGLTYAHDIGLLLLWIAALLTLQTGIGYIVAGLRHVYPPSRVTSTARRRLNQTSTEELMITILYFAWLREHTRCATEEIPLSANMQTVADLVHHLQQLSDGHAKALADMDTVRVAVNRSYGSLDTKITSGDEIALFPPVTGG